MRGRRRRGGCRVVLFAGRDPMRGRDRDKGTERHRGTSKLGQKQERDRERDAQEAGGHTQNPGKEREGHEALEAGRVCREILLLAGTQRTPPSPTKALGAELSDSLQRRQGRTGHRERDGGLRRGGRRTGYAGPGSRRARDPRSERRGPGSQGHTSPLPPPRPPRPPVSQPSEWRVAPRACRAAQSECPNLSGPWLCHLWKERPGTGWRRVERAAGPRELSSLGDTSAGRSQQKSGAGEGFSAEPLPRRLMFMQDSRRPERARRERFLLSQLRIISSPPPPTPPLGICTGFLRTFPRRVRGRAGVDTASDTQRRSCARTWWSCRHPGAHRRTTRGAGNSDRAVPGPGRGARAERQWLHGRVPRGRGSQARSPRAESQGNES